MCWYDGTDTRSNPQEDNEEKWQEILKHYNHLLQIAYSPIAALNRTYALARVKGNEAGLQEALKLKLETYSLYFCLLAELVETQKAKQAYLEQALSVATTAHEKTAIKERLRKLQKEGL